MKNINELFGHLKVFIGSLALVGVIIFGGQESLKGLISGDLSGALNGAVNSQNEEEPENPETEFHPEFEDKGFLEQELQREREEKENLLRELEQRQEEPQYQEAYHNTADSNENEWNPDEEIEYNNEEQEIFVEMNENDHIVWNSTRNSEYGFKVIWSHEPFPEYPVREGMDEFLYFEADQEHEAWIYPFQGEGQYFVRVCEYLGDGQCGAYSEQLETELWEK